ncbi:hypothetical protein A5752_10050 [Mycobacterium sp. 852002-51961_SCH5331710]|nr:hypothetical protein A5752_10050 [Mycobacterium sp. 852002-51961_SCH5331710]
MDNRGGQLDAAAAAVELDEVEPESLDPLPLDFSDDDFSEEVDFSDEALEPLLEPFDELLPASRLSVR